jgi:hypothetical protein
MATAWAEEEEVAEEEVAEEAAAQAAGSARARRRALSTA